MPAAGVQTRQSEGAASPPRRPGDVSTGMFVGPALRGPLNRMIEIRSAGELDELIGPAFGGSHLRRSIDRFFSDGGSRAFVARVALETATAATGSALEVAGDDPEPVLEFEADGPGAWGNDITITIADGSTMDRRTITVTDNGRVRVQVEVASAAEAKARASRPGLVTVSAGAGAWPPAPGTITLTGGLSSDSTVTPSDTVAAIERIPASVGPCTLMAPGDTNQSVHEAIMRLARARGWHYHLDLPDISDTLTLLATAATLRSVDDEIPGRSGKLLWPWEVVPIGPYLTVNVPPSAGQAGRDARADRTDRQRQGRAAAGPEYVAVDAIDVTQVPSDTDWDLLADAGVTVLRREPEGVCAMGARTLVSADRWPQYLFSTGARTRMAILDEARAAVRSELFKALDGDGVQLEVIRGRVVAVCQPYRTRGQLYAQDGDEGFAVEVVSTVDDLRQGRVRIRLALRTAPSTELIVIEFTAAAVGSQL